MNVYIGIDPGMSGGVAVVTPWMNRVDLYVTDKGNETDLWTWLGCKVLIPDPDSDSRLPIDIFAAIEQQVARPTTFFNRLTNKMERSILKSTCILYGHYQMLRGFLIASNVPHEEVLPQRWQKALGIPSREKGTTDNHWKNVLKAKAQKLYPHAPVTLATADALLLAEYARRVREGVTA